MTKGSKVKNIMMGCAALLFCVLLLIDGEEDIEVIVMGVNITLIFTGLRLLVYYFTMARFMTGGLVVFYRAIIRLDLGLFFLNIKSFPREVTFMYLIGSMLITGVSDILHSWDAKKAKITTWFYEFSFGISQVVLSVISIAFLHSARLLILVYAIGLIQTAVSYFCKAFFKQEIYGKISPG